MPDLQSELKKLENLKFDDDPEDDATNHAPTYGPREKSQVVWRFVRDNPQSNAGDVAKGTQLGSSFCSSILSQMAALGQLSRTKEDSYFRYSVTDPNWKPKTPLEAIEAANAARATKLRKEKKAKARKAAAVTKATAPSQTATDDASTAVLTMGLMGSSSAKAFVASLPLAQARAIYNELKEFF